MNVKSHRLKRTFVFVACLSALAYIALDLALEVWRPIDFITTQYFNAFMGLCGLVEGLPWHHRPLCQMLLLIAVGITLAPSKATPKKMVIGLWVIALLSPLSPIDVTFKNVPGPPRVVPLVMGYPTGKAGEAAQQGEIVLGGCLVNGFEPKWVLVW